MRFCGAVRPHRTSDLASNGTAACNFGVRCASGIFGTFEIGGMRSPTVKLQNSRGEAVECARHSTARAAKRKAPNLDGVRVASLPGGGYDWFPRNVGLPRGARVVARWSEDQGWK